MMADPQGPVVPTRKEKLRALWTREDSCYHSYSPEEEEEEEEQDVEVFQEVLCWYSILDQARAESFDDDESEDPDRQ